MYDINGKSNKTDSTPYLKINMNYLGLTVFAGNTPGLILDFDSATKEYTVEFTDGRVVKTAKVFWDKTIPSEPDIAFYRQSSVGNGERLVYDPEIGWDVVSAAEDGIDIVSEPSDLNEWVDDYTEDSDSTDVEAHSDMESKLDEVLDILHDMDERGDLDKEEDNAIEDVDHDATEDSYWDRTLKPNPMAMDNEFGSGEYNERNDGALPGGRAMSAKVAKDCGCWDGYKRVPGTKPCAPGSCEKCDAGRKEAAAKKKQSPEEAVKKVNKVPPAGVRAAAKRGLKYYAEGKAGDGFEAATAARARKIAAGEELTEEHINRMHSFFERHAGGRSKKAKPGEITAWDVAWLCWGGDAGRSWAAKVDAQLHKARHPNAKGKHSADAGAGVFDIVNNEDDTDHMRSDIGGNSNVRHAEGEVEKNMDDGGLHDQEGNPEMRGLGSDDAEPEAKGVKFPEMPEEVIDTLLNNDDFKQLIHENIVDYLENDEDIARHSHVRDENEWEDARLSSFKFSCPKCSDPLIDSMCHCCGEDRSEYVRQANSLARIAKTFAPYAEELGSLFGEALANQKTSVTEPSEDIFAVHLHGQDSDPSIGGTGGYNAEHGDSPELLKDIVGENSGWIDATPEDDEKAASDPEKVVAEGIDGALKGVDSEKVQKVVEMAEKIFSVLLGDKFKDKNMEAKKKQSFAAPMPPGQTMQSDQQQSILHADDYTMATTADGRSVFIPKTMLNQNPQTAPMGEAQTTPMAYVPQTSEIAYAQPGTNTPQAPSPIQGRAEQGIVGQIGQQIQAAISEEPAEFDAYEDLGPDANLSLNPEVEDDMEAKQEDIVDIDGDPLEIGAVYQVFSGQDQEPDIVEVVDYTPEHVSLKRIDSAFPEEGDEPYEVTIEEFNVNDMRFDRRNSIHPNEIDEDSINDPLDGTPETMDDAGPGQNDMVGETDLSTGRKASTEHIAGRHYLPNQQKDFVNERGKARNLDKLVLEGTHYLDGEVTANDSFDDNFLFGV